LAQFGDAQFDCADPGLPVAVAKTVAMIGSPGAALTVAGAAQSVGLQGHQPFGSKADHLAQERRVRALLQ
jgi:hypothetical protein